MLNPPRGLGGKVDRVVGSMSRLLHVRPAKHNTRVELERYLERPKVEMFPEPPPLTGVTPRRSLMDRVIHSSTLSWPSAHRVLDPTYRRRHESEYRKNLMAWMRWVRPEGARRKRIILYVHGWLEPGSWAEEATLFRKWGRELDVDLAHVSLPFHGRRNPRGSLFSGEFFFTADFVRSVEAVRQAVCDARSAMAWLREQGYEQVGIAGLSLGGSLTMLLGCLEPAPDFIIPIISHLELAEAVEHAAIMWRMKRDLEKWGIHEGERREIMRRLGWSDYEAVVPVERQLWIQAREDAYIDAALAEGQWRRWGEPPILWIEGGHMTFPLELGKMTRRMSAFLAGLPLL